MRILPLLICCLLLSAALAAPAGTATKRTSAPSSEAQKAFDRLKSLAGAWKGTAQMGAMGNMSAMVSAPVRVTLRVTSGGAAILHEMTPEGRADDPTNGDDDPVTMLYMDHGRLLLTHYCDSGKNRPRMAARMSPDGQSVEFAFVDLGGDPALGHMSQASFTFIDADHHSEEWTFTGPDHQPSHAHITLERAR